MEWTRQFALFLVLAAGGCSPTPGDHAIRIGDAEIRPGKKLVIAHRGASGYLPEHTLAAKAMAHAQGADFIEQDLVMTKDDKLIVLHDHFLDAVTNVREVFPGRARDDGRFYVIDFSLDEIRRLTVVERFNRDEGMHAPVFKDRFPAGKFSFRVHTFEEELELIQGLNISTGRAVGIYPEIKSPAYHHDEGKDIASAVLAVLQQYGYSSESGNVYLQCFDPPELQRIHAELLPRMNMSLPLIQLIRRAPDNGPLLTKQGLGAISEYAVGIAPSMHLLVDPDSQPSDLRVTELAEMAHAAGLQVHPYTFRREVDQLPQYASDYEDLLRIFLDQVGVDGVFTDFPDLTVAYVESRWPQAGAD